MPHLFNPRLINPPDKDPGLFIPFFFNKRAVIIDLGDINALFSRDILKLSQIFISHTHMDHFTGFDRVLRLALGRDMSISIFGPKGIIDNVYGKLSGYTWNLVENYVKSLSIHVHEIQQGEMLSCGFECKTGFKPFGKKIRPIENNIIFNDTGFEVKTAVLDHDIACLGYSLTEHFHVNIRSDALTRLGLKPGPWLYSFKEAIMAGDDRQMPVSAPVTDGSDEIDRTREFTLGELTDLLTVITPGEKIAYITDASGSRENIDKIIDLVKNADRLFIEAAFLDKDRQLAKKKCHLTAFQAGMIAARAKTKRFTLFHFSPRYTGEYGAFYEEAERAFAEYGGKIAGL
ncbi:MAG: ribonuclease Z [Deltaproteobacteria bacterium]|nr:ribonuclease Z [Deltaproteobacteria bacterium]